MDQTNETVEDHGPLFSLKRADEAIGVIALLAIVGAILWGVVSRYIFPRPAAWTYEVSVIAFAYLVFFGTIAGIRLGSHAAVDLLVEVLPKSWQRAIIWFNYVLLAAFFLLLAGLFAQQAWIARTVHTVALDLPRSVIYAPLAIACIGMLIAHLIVERPWVAHERHHADSVI